MAKIIMVNITENELYIPLEDVCTHLKNVACVLPYCRQVRQQLLDGRMYDIQIIIFHLMEFMFVSEFTETAHFFTRK